MVPEVRRLMAHPHVIMFSGGIGSWGAARRVRERHPDAPITLLFADTLIEDPDLYRFLDEAAEDVGGDLIRIAEGRTPWEVFRDVRFLGNSRVDPCSRILKREVCDQWMDANADRATTTIYLGIDWTEDHRLTGVQGRMGKLGWPRIEAPLCDEPYVLKARLMDDLRERGIEPPRLYALGFPHNNCGGFCIKAGHAHFDLLRRALPDVYEASEAQEESLRDLLGDVSVLKDRRGGESTPMSLREFRERMEAGGLQLDLFDWGGCGCFMEDE
jgi:hypothetical protein